MSIDHHKLSLDDLREPHSQMREDICIVHPVDAHLAVVCRVAVLAALPLTALNVPILVAVDGRFKGQHDLVDEALEHEQIIPVVSFRDVI